MWTRNFDEIANYKISYTSYEFTLSLFPSPADSIICGVCSMMWDVQDKLLAANACRFLGIERRRYETTHE